MILPANHEDLNDQELEDALVEMGAYERPAAAAVVQIVRHPEGEPVD